MEPEVGDAGFGEVAGIGSRKSQAMRRLRAGNEIMGHVEVESESLDSWAGGRRMLVTCPGISIRKELHHT